MNKQDKDRIRFLIKEFYIGTQFIPSIGSRDIYSVGFTSALMRMIRPTPKKRNKKK